MAEGIMYTMACAVGFFGALEGSEHNFMAMGACLTMAALMMVIGVMFEAIKEEREKNGR